MKKKKNIILLILVFIGLFFSIGGHFYNDYYHKKIKNKPIRYPYHTYRGTENPILIISESKYQQSLIDYYLHLEQGENPFFNFPLKTLPISEPVYVVDYTKDSLFDVAITT